MYDSIEWRAIPRDAELVAGYIDGPLSKWPDAAWQAFPNAIRICTWGPRHLGNCLDIEAGDSIPSDIPDWTDNALARGVRNPIIYCSLSDWAACRAHAGSRPVQWWIAHYTNIPHIPIGADACQWSSSPAITGGGYDLSLCQPWFPKPL